MYRKLYCQHMKVNKVVLILMNNEVKHSNKLTRKEVNDKNQSCVTKVVNGC